MIQSLSFMAKISIMHNTAADLLQHLDGPFSSSFPSQFTGPLANHFDNMFITQLDAQFENTLSKQIDSNTERLWELLVLQIRAPIVVALRKIFDEGRSNDQKTSNIM